MKAMVASNMGHQCALIFENNDVNGRCEICGTGVPSGTIPYTPMGKEFKTVHQLEGRPVTYTFWWDEEKHAFCLWMEDLQYPVRVGGRHMNITRTLIDANTMETVYAQTNLADNTKCGYTGFMTRVV